VNKRGVKHTEHKYHFQLLGACQHRQDTIHSRAIHLYSNYLYKKTPITQGDTIPTLIFLSSENVTKKYIARVVGFKRLVGRSADPTFLEAQAKFDLQKKMQKLLVSSEKEKNKPPPPQIRALLLVPFFFSLELQ
jgi:hypothetical protein